MLSSHRLCGPMRERRFLFIFFVVLILDVTPPKFLNCHTMLFYVDKMEAATFVVPTALDNSGLVKNVTVMPYNFKPGTVVSEDVNVTYTAVDNSGNSATCTISFIIKGIKMSF